MGWFVYILRCSDGTLYTGIAVDLKRRLDAHRRGIAAKYTRCRLPVKLAYQEQQPDRSNALKREAALRRLGRAGKLALIGTSRSTRGEPAEAGPDVEQLCTRQRGASSPSCRTIRSGFFMKAVHPMQSSASFSTAVRPPNTKC